MATKKKVEEVFKVGQWVRLLKKQGLAAKGTLAVVSYVGEEAVEDYDEETDSYEDTGEIDRSYHLVYGCDGDTVDYAEPKNLEAIKTPEYVVSWTNEYTDPVGHFVTRGDADKFKKKILGKVYKGEKVIEANVYKLVK